MKLCPVTPKIAKRPEKTSAELTHVGQLVLEYFLDATLNHRVVQIPRYVQPPQDCENHFLIILMFQAIKSIFHFFLEYSLITSAWPNQTNSPILSYWLIVCGYEMSASRRASLSSLASLQYTTSINYSFARALSDLVLSLGCVFCENPKIQIISVEASSLCFTELGNNKV